MEERPAEGAAGKGIQTSRERVHGTMEGGQPFGPGEMPRPPEWGGVRFERGGMHARENEKKSGLYRAFTI
jgi:hypothetical protein